MQEVSEFFKRLFSPSGWPARWYCGNWTAFHGWLYIISSVLIALAYFSIPLILLYLIRKAQNKLPFQKIFWLFLFFILACGFTHVLDAVMFWLPVYRLSATVLFITAIVSWIAVVGLFKVIPMALTLKSPEILETIIQDRTLDLEKANKILSQTNLDLLQAKKDTEILLKQKDEFLSIASHELKTPVTSLKAYTQLLSAMQHKNPDDMQKIHDKIETQINKMVVLINDLLDVTKIQEGIFFYEKKKMNLNEIILEVTEDMQRISANNTIVVEITETVEIIGDKDRISQALINLLSNAVKYSKGNTSIIIKVIKENTKVVCSVQDFGLGIPNEHKARIFEKFYRVKGANRETYPGLGLGLHIVQDIITKHDGNLWLESEEGKGSIFYFSLASAN